MKKLILLILLYVALLFSTKIAFSQVSPFNVPPKWMFGKGAGLSFIGGTLPTSPILSPPIYLAGNPNTDNQEGATSVSDTTRNVVYYTPDGVNLYNGANTLVANNLKGGASSTQNSISFPDPASPTNQFYVVTANVDPAGGSSVGTSNGISYVLYNTAGALLGSGNLIGNKKSGEFITSSSDMNGGYWIISHQGEGIDGSGNKYLTWHVTSGGISAMNSFAGTINGVGYQGSLKISNCQNKIGFANYGSGVEIYNWNPTTGTLGALIYSNTVISYGMLYGAEFSPDGSKFYYTSLIAPKLGLYQIDMSAGNLLSTISTVPANSISEFGTMQLASDGKIYVINTSNFDNPAYIPCITQPNNPAATVGYNNHYFSYVPTPFYPNFYRGIANLGWTNPNLPVITPIVSGSCNIFNFKYVFKAYFNYDINVVPNSEVWDFGDGTGPLAGLGATPSHTLPAGNGTYTVKLTVTDATCNQLWSNTVLVNVVCGLPVDLIEYTAQQHNDKIVLNWVTAKENDVKYFEIYKSTDGINYNMFYVLNPKGTFSGNNMNNYTIYDDKPSYGLNYYKLCEYDINNQRTDLGIRSVSMFGDVNVVLGPNPFTLYTTINFYGVTNSTIKVVDQLGRIVYEAKQGTNTTMKIGEDLPYGYYFIQIITEQKEYSFSIVKKQ